MSLINRMTLYIIVFLIIFITLVSIGLIIFMYYRRKAAKRLIEETDLRNLPQEDAEAFVPIEDIADDMIIAPGGKRFVAVIRCRGFDFYTVNDEEKLRTKNNYRAFLSSFTSRVTYRMYGEDVNMDHTMKLYEETFFKLQEQAFNETESYKEAKEIFDSVRGNGSIQEKELEKYLLESKKKLKSYDWRLAHMESQMRYIGRVSGPSSGRQRLIQTYVVDWYNRDELISGILTDKQLHEKAVTELDKICRNKIRQLGDAGVRAYRCKTRELIEMNRLHFHPVSGNRYSYEQFEGSTYYDMVTTTDTLDQMDEQYEDELVEEMMIGGGLHA